MDNPIDVDALEQRFAKWDCAPSRQVAYDLFVNMLTALRQQQETLEQYSLAKKLDELVLEEKDAEITRLRAVIEEAPHAYECDIHLCMPGEYECNCWKRKALENKT